MLEKRKKNTFPHAARGASDDWRAALKMPHHPSNCTSHVRCGAVNENKCPLCDTSVKPLKTNRDWRERAAGK